MRHPMIVMRDNNYPAHSWYRGLGPPWVVVPSCIPPQVLLHLHPLAGEFPGPEGEFHLAVVVAAVIQVGRIAPSSPVP